MRKLVEWCVVFASAPAGRGVPGVEEDDPPMAAGLVKYDSLFRVSTMGTIWLYIEDMVDCLYDCCCCCIIWWCFCCWSCRDSDIEVTELLLGFLPLKRLLFESEGLLNELILVARTCIEFIFLRYAGTYALPWPFLCGGVGSLVLLVVGCSSKSVTFVPGCSCLSESKLSKLMKPLSS